MLNRRPRVRFWNDFFSPTIITPQTVPPFFKTNQTALIYTLNVNEEIVKRAGYDRHFALTKMSFEMVFGDCELLLSTDTLQYHDYSKFESKAFDGEAKRKRREEIFPEECKRAFELGVRLAAG